MANDNDNDKYKRPRLRTQPRILLRSVLGSWPFLVWLAAVGLVFWLHKGSEQFGNVMGVVDAIDQDIAPTETARIASIDVVPGQSVEAGQVVARLDTALLDASAAFEDMNELLAAEEVIARSRQSVLGMMRQMDGTLASARAAYASEKLRQSQAEAELAELKKEHQRREELLARRLMREEDVTALLPRIASLEKAAEAYPELLSIHEAHIESALANYRTMERLLDLADDEGNGTGLIRAQREARERLLAAARAMRDEQRESYALRSAMSGEISRIYRLPGEVVPAGTPVVRVVNRHSTHVIAFIREGQTIPIELGQRVFVWRLQGGAARAAAVVEAIAPDIQTLPGRISPMQGQVVRGRRVQIRLAGGHEFFPGETVQVQITRPAWMQSLAHWLRQLFWKGHTEPTST